MNKSKLIFVSVFCILVAVISNSCTKTVGKPPVAVSGCDTITFAKHIKPLIDTYCISCHGTTPSPGAPPFTTYAEVKIYVDNGQFHSTIFDGIPELMPQGGPPLPQD